MRFYSFILVGMLSVAALIPARAQLITPSQEKDVTIVYVAKDQQLLLEPLKNLLRNINQRAVRNEAPTVFYFANAEKPHLVLVNTEDAQPNEFDDKAFALADGSNPSLDIDYDHRQLLSIINGMGIIDEGGNLTCQSLDLCFLVSKTFWQRGGNKDLIAALWFELGLARFRSQNKLKFSVYVPPSEIGEAPLVDSSFPYGTTGPDGINEISPKPY